jgi:hypothetical protein
MAWYDTVPQQVDSEIQVLERVTRLVNKEQRQVPVDVIDLVANKANALTQEQDNRQENERKTKKRHLHESDNSGNSTR